MASWAEFEAAAPELVEEGKRLFYQFGVGLGFLATVREDGGPRLHPVCPVIAADGLYVFVVPSPKRADLRRDGRYALHSYPPEEVDDEFCVTGRATEVGDPDIREAVAEAYHDEVAEGWSLFVLDIERCLHAKYRHRGDWPPTYTKWAGSTMTQGSQAHFGSSASGSAGACAGAPTPSSSSPTRCSPPVVSLRRRISASRPCIAADGGACMPP